MEMTDLLSKDEWMALEKELNERFGVNACAYSDQGFTFTGYKNFGNPLCPAIKSAPGGLQAVCSVAHQNMAAQAKATAKTVMAECDAGLLKICVPVFSGGEFVGIVGGCGRLPEGGEVDVFAVHKATSLPEGEIEKLAADVTVIPQAEADQMAALLEKKVQGLTA